MVVDRNAAPKEAGWKPIFLATAVVVAWFGGLALLSLFVAPGAPIYDTRVESAIGFAAVGAVLWAVAFWLLRPGSWWLKRHAELQEELTRLVGKPTELLAATARFDAGPATDELNKLGASRLSILLFAFGPRGVAVGRPGRRPRCVVLARADSRVSLGIGGPGGGALRPKSEDRPQLTIHISRDDGELSASLDSLGSNVNPLGMRDVAEVKQLISRLELAISTQEG